MLNDVIYDMISFFIHYEVPQGRGAASFILAVRHQNL